MADRLKRGLGSTVRAARKRAGLTQDELASRIGKTPESVSNIERGAQSPTVETLGALARELGLPVADFFDETADLAHASDKRLRAEARLRELARALDDDALELIIEYVSALERFINKKS